MMYWLTDIILKDLKMGFAEATVLDALHLVPSVFRVNTFDCLACFHTRPPLWIAHDTSSALCACPGMSLPAHL